MDGEDADGAKKGGLLGMGFNKGSLLKVGFAMMMAFATPRVMGALEHLVFDQEKLTALESGGGDGSHRTADL